MQGIEPKEHCTLSLSYSPFSLECIHVFYILQQQFTICVLQCLNCSRLTEAPGMSPVAHLTCSPRLFHLEKCPLISGDLLPTAKFHLQGPLQVILVLHQHQAICVELSCKGCIKYVDLLLFNSTFSIVWNLLLYCYISTFTCLHIAFLGKI